MDTPAAVPVPAAPPLSFPARVIGILTSPRATFERIVAHPTWVAPLLLMVLVVGGANFFFLRTDVGQQAMLEQQVSTMESFGQTVNDAQYEAMKRQGAFTPYIQLVSILVLSPVMLVVITGILHGVFAGILGGGATFRQSLAVVSHAGIVNVLHHARASFPGVPLHAVLGGLHLSGTNEKIIPETIAALKDFGLARIGAGHCTGWRAMAALGEAFGDDVLAPSAVGKRYWF